MSLLGHGVQVSLLTGTGGEIGIADFCFMAYA